MNGQPRGSRLLAWLAGRERPRPLLERSARGHRPLAGEDPARQQWRVLEPPPPPGSEPRVGICCSGGGIRSASYNLGALQALREARVLEAADYLAAVSGGAYIAISHAIVGSTLSAPGAFCAEAPVYGRLSPEEQYLRNHTTYLAPGGRGRVWFLYNLLVGLASNALVVVAVLYPLARALGWLVAGIHPGLQEVPGDAASDAFTVGWWAWAGGALAAPAALIAWARRRRGRRGRWSWPLGTAVALAAGAAAWALLPLVWWLLHRDGQASGGGAPAFEWWMWAAMAALFGGGVLLILADRVLSRFLAPQQWLIELARVWTFRLFLLGLLAALLLVGLPLGIVAARWIRERDLLQGVAVWSGIPQVNLAAMLTAAGAVVGAVGAVYRFAVGKGRWLVPFAAVAAGPLSIVFALVVMANGAASAGFERDHLGPWWGSLLVLGVVEVLLSNNHWSMHPFYRHRLASAFALRRLRHDQEGTVDAGEVPYSKPLRFSALEPQRGPGADLPELVVCCALNVSGDLVPPGRRAASFTFTRGASGSPLTGYVPTGDLEDWTGVRDLTLPAIMAISGAALSPSMGKQGYPGARLLFTLFNVRLGVWIPNPLRYEDWTAERRRRADQGRPYRAWAWLLDQWRRPGVAYLIREALGSNRVDRPYLYVSDGGHWENLGLVELLRRGCTRIWCLDASGDGLDRFDTLGEAIALARSELGVEIELDPHQLERDPGTCLSPASHVIGTFTYPGGQGVTGELIYVRACVPSNAPWDVQAYAERDRHFPSTSTLVQLFDDQRFEAYRALGHLAAREAVAGLQAHLAATAPAPGPPQSNGSGPPRPARRQPARRRTAPSRPG